VVIAHAAKPSKRKVYSKKEKGDTHTRKR